MLIQIYFWSFIKIIILYYLQAKIMKCEFFLLLFRSILESPKAGFWYVIFWCVCRCPYLFKWFVWISNWKDLTNLSITQSESTIWSKICLIIWKGNWCTEENIFFLFMKISRKWPIWAYSNLVKINIKKRISNLLTSTPEQNCLIQELQLKVHH